MTVINAGLSILSTYPRNLVYRYVEMVRDSLFNAMMEIIMMATDVVQIVKFSLNILVTEEVQIVKIHAQNTNQNLSKCW